MLLFDSVAGKYLPDRAVLIADGKVAAVGAGGATKAPADATVIDGRGKTLTPGLWDAHRHVGGDDWNLLQNVATGMTNYRSPGSMIDESLSIMKRRAAGDLLAPDGKVSVIIDRKDPLAAQGPLTVSSAVVREWKIGGYPLFDRLTRDDFRKSFARMVGVVGRLHKAGGRSSRAPTVGGWSWFASSNCTRKRASPTRKRCRPQRSCLRG